MSFVPQGRGSTQSEASNSNEPKLTTTERLAAKRNAVQPVMKYADAERLLARANDSVKVNAKIVLAGPRAITPRGPHYFHIRNSEFVDTSSSNWTCTCNPTRRDFVCLDVAALAFWMQGRDRRRYEHIRRKTAKRDFAEYNAWKAAEAPTMPRLIASLVDSVRDAAPVKGKRGRKPYPDSQMAFCALARTWTGTPLRGVDSELRRLDLRAFLDRKPSFNRIGRWLNEEHVSGILEELLRVSASWFGKKETWLAIDATGIGCGVYSAYYESKLREYGKDQEIRVDDFVMASWVVGADTAVIASVAVWAKELSKEIRKAMERLEASAAFRQKRLLRRDMSWMEGRARGEAPYFEELVTDAKLRLPRTKTITGDKAYGGNRPYEVAERLGLDPWLCPKDNEIPNNSSTRLRAERVAMWHAERARFMAHYAGHQNVESVNHMVKANIGRSVRSRSWRAILNEVLCFAIVHNLQQAIRHDVMPPLPPRVAARLARWHITLVEDVLQLQETSSSDEAEVSAT